MKKTLAILTVIIMLFALVSCGESDVKGKISGNLPDQQTQAPENTYDLEIGTVNGQTYESDFLNIKMTMGDDWYLYSDEEIAQLNNVSVSAFDEDYQEIYKNASTFYDLFAQNLVTSETINILFEKVNTVAAIALDEEDYMDATIDGFSHIDSNSGMSIASYEKDMDSKLGDRTVPSLALIMDYSGVSVYERCFIFKKGAYFATLTIASVSEESLDEIISCFSSAD